MRKIIIRIITKIVFWWGSLWYDKKYLTGIYFDRNHFSNGWSWILKYWVPQKVLGYEKHVPFPVPKGVQYSAPENINFNPDDLPSLQAKGCYFQAVNASIMFKKGIKIAPNCGFITANHVKKIWNNMKKGKVL